MYEIPFFSIYQKLLNRHAVRLTTTQLSFLQNLGLSFERDDFSRFILKWPSLYDNSFYQDEISFKQPILLNKYWFTTSTLDHLKLDHVPMLCWADMQSHGRGQYQRTWISKIGRQLLITLKIPLHWVRFDCAVLKFVPILSVLDLLQSPEKKLFIKWPNDCYSADGKVAGVLLYRDAHSIAISLGLNWTLLPFESGIDAIYHDYARSRAQFLERWVEQVMHYLSKPCSLSHQEEVLYLANQSSFFATGDRCVIINQHTFDEKKAIYQKMLIDGSCAFHDHTNFFSVNGKYSIRKI